MGEGGEGQEDGGKDGIAQFREEEEKGIEEQRHGNAGEEILKEAQILSESVENMEVAREAQPGPIKGDLVATLPSEPLALKGGQMATLPRLPPSSPRCRLSLALSEPGGRQDYQPAELNSPKFCEMASPSLRPVNHLMSPNLRPGGELASIPRVRPVEQGSSGIVMGQASLTLTRASPRQRRTLSKNR